MYLQHGAMTSRLVNIIIACACTTRSPPGTAQTGPPHCKVSIRWESYPVDRNALGDLCLEFLGPVRITIRRTMEKVGASLAPTHTVFLTSSGPGKLLFALGETCI